MDTWGPAPRDDGLAYPGIWPDRSILLGTDQHWPLDIEPGRPLDQARVHDSSGTAPLDRALTGLGRPPMAARFPVLAVGSNAAPAQVRHKFRHPRSPVMPLIEVTVTGMAVAAAAQVAPYGAVPATPVFGHNLSCRLFVAWLDTQQLSHMDATEGVGSVHADVGYERRHLTTSAPDPAPCLDPDPGPDSASGPLARSAVRLQLSDGRQLPACFAYVARGGHLADPAPPPSVPPRPLLLFTAQNRDQRALLARLLSASPGLRAALGDTPERWVATVLADPTAAQDAFSQTLRAEQRIIQPGSADTSL